MQQEKGRFISQIYSILRIMIVQEQKQLWQFGDHRPILLSSSSAFASAEIITCILPIKYIFAFLFSVFISLSIQRLLWCCGYHHFPDCLWSKCCNFSLPTYILTQGIHRVVYVINSPLIFLAWQSPKRQLSGWNICSIPSTSSIHTTYIKVPGAQPLRKAIFFLKIVQTTTSFVL